MIARMGGLTSVLEFIESDVACGGGVRGGVGGVWGESWSGCGWAEGEGRVLRI